MIASATADGAVPIPRARQVQLSHRLADEVMRQVSCCILAYDAMQAVAAAAEDSQTLQ